MGYFPADGTGAHSAAAVGAATGAGTAGMAAPNHGRATTPMMAARLGKGMLGNGPSRIDAGRISCRIESVGYFRGLVEATKN